MFLCDVTSVPSYGLLKCEATYFGACALKRTVSQDYHQYQTLVSHVCTVDHLCQQEISTCHKLTSRLIKDAEQTRTYSI
jgi:hypothetical protein